MILITNLAHDAVFTKIENFKGGDQEVGKMKGSREEVISVFTTHCQGGLTRLKVSPLKLENFFANSLPATCDVYEKKRGYK